MKQGETVSGDSVEGWLRGLVPERGLARQSRAVVQAAASHPGRVSHAPAAEVAELAGVNVGTVTRTAQALGFAGWPSFQRELRARYLSHLTAPEVAGQHDAGSTPAAASLRRDLDQLALVTRDDLEGVRAMAVAVGAARRTLVLGDGSYASVAIALAHNARIAGYDVEAVVGGGADTANRLAAAQPGDVLVVVTFWRLYENAVLAAEVARSRGVQVWVLTDAVAPELSAVADGVVTVPAEGVAFFPSLTAGLAVAQAVVSELAALDPARSRAAVAAADEQWRTFGLLHRGDPARSSGR